MARYKFGRSHFRQPSQRYPREYWRPKERLHIPFSGTSLGKKGTRESISYDSCSHVFAVKSFTINGLLISSITGHSTAINHLRISSRTPAGIFREEPRLTSMLSIWNLNTSPRDISCISQLACPLNVTSIMIIIAVITITACAQLLYLEGAEWLPKQQCVEGMSPSRQPTLRAAPIISPFLIPSTVFLRRPTFLCEALSADVFCDLDVPLAMSHRDFHFNVRRQEPTLHWPGDGGFLLTHLLNVIDRSQDF